jgi:hypothetical protein
MIWSLKGIVYASVWFTLWLAWGVNVQAAMAPFTGQTDVATLRLNQKSTQDVELVPLKPGVMLVPVKYLAQLLDVPVAQSSESFTVSFTHPVSGLKVRIDAENHSLTVGETQQPLLHVAFVPQGLFSQNEVFIPLPQAATLLGVQLIMGAQGSQTLDLTIDRAIKLLAQQNDPGTLAQKRNHLNNQAPTDLPQVGNQLLDTVTLDLNDNRNQTTAGLGQPVQVHTLVISPQIEGHLFNKPYLVHPVVSRVNGTNGLTGVTALWQPWQTAHHRVMAGTLTAH